MTGLGDRVFSDRFRFCYKDSFEPLLGVLRPLVPHSLVGSASWAAVRDWVRWLPVGVADHEFGFECSLTNSAPTADFGFALAPGFPTSDRVCQLVGARWPRFGSVLCLLLSRQAAAARAIRRVFLEFDVRGQASVPGLFVVARRPYDRYLAPAAVFSVGAGGLGPPGVSHVDLHSILETVVSAGAVVPSLGVFPGRSPGVVRVDVVPPDREAAVRIADRLGWPGDREELTRVLRSFPSAVTLWLGFDFVAGPVPTSRLGVEAHAGLDGWLTPADGLWREVFGLLGAQGLSVPNKNAAALECVGPNTFEVLGRGGSPYVVNRGVNHVKVVLGDRLSAKVYLGFSFGDLFSAS